MKEIFLLGYNEEKEFQDFLQQMEKKFNIKIRCSPALGSLVVACSKGLVASPQLLTTTARGVVMCG
jgi:hypothetical protein